MLTYIGLKRKDRQFNVATLGCKTNVGVNVWCLNCLLPASWWQNLFPLLRKLNRANAFLEQVCEFPIQKELEALTRSKWRRSSKAKLSCCAFLASPRSRQNVHLAGNSDLWEKQSLYKNEIHPMFGGPQETATNCAWLQADLSKTLCFSGKTACRRMANKKQIFPLQNNFVRFPWMGDQENAQPNNFPHAIQFSTIIENMFWKLPTLEEYVFVEGHFVCLFLVAWGVFNRTKYHWKNLSASKWNFSESSWCPASRRKVDHMAGPPVNVRGLSTGKLWSSFQQGPRECVPLCFCGTRTDAWEEIY